MPVQNPMMYQPPTYDPVNLPQRPIYGQQMNQPNLASLGQSNISMTSNLTGRIIQNENEITPNEVAMDGSVSLFPLGDYSAIIAKQWNANGTISTIKYVPVVDNEDGNNRGAAAATTSDLQNGFDTQSILNKLNGINSGLCDGFYAMNSGMLQGNFGLQQAINQVAVGAMQNTNALQTQLAECCCENRQGQAQIQYQMATDTCAITNSINQAARDITDNANANYRQLHDELIAMRMEDKNDQIAELRTQIQQKDLAASQCAQNAYLIDQLRPAAVPAFQVPNPYANYGFGCYCNNNVA